MRVNNPRRKRRGKRWLSSRTWFAIHAWSGFKLGILLFVVFASGTLATISHELDWLAHEPMRVDARGSDYDFAAMLEGLYREFPAAHVDLLDRPEAPGFAAVARIRDPALGVRRVLVDPYDGNVLDHAHWYASFQRFLRDFHRYLLLPNFLGIYVVGATAFLVMASLISSFWIYPNWWRGFFRFRAGRSGSAGFWKEVHKLFGVWSMVFILLMGITGIWYVVEFTMGLAGAGHILQFERPRLSPAAVERLEPGQRQLAPETVLDIARAELPGIRIGGVYPPGAPDAPWYITGQTGEVLVRDRASHVFIDPYNGEILRRQRAGELGPLRRWVDTADPLHFGGFAGLWSKIPYLIFGTAMSVLAATGVWLRWKRIRVMLRRDAAKAARGRRARMGAWKWATAAVFMLAIVTGASQISRYDLPASSFRPSGEIPVEISGVAVPALVFRDGPDRILALDSRRHFDPVRHAVSVPGCATDTFDVEPTIHHHALKLAGHGEMAARCLVKSIATNRMPDL